MADAQVNEAERYQQARGRLIGLLTSHPWLADISVALAGRKCTQCGRARVVERPADHFRCTACSHEWKQGAVRR